jgi:signal transduction histidine kinase
LNAIQASPRGSEVDVRQGARNGHCVIKVADHGPGISPEAQERLFEPFFTTKERGTGLGLAISQRIITAHRGEIRIFSPGGCGTTVEILLPLSTVGASGASHE